MLINNLSIHSLIFPPPLAFLGSLVHVIMNEHGPEVTKHFLDKAQQVVNYWLLHRGFSVGIGDTIADEATMAKINQTITTAKVRHPPPPPPFLFLGSN